MKIKPLVSITAIHPVQSALAYFLFDHNLCGDGF